MRLGLLSRGPLSEPWTAGAAYIRMATRAWAAAGNDVHVLAPGGGALEGATVHAYDLPSDTDETLTVGLRAFGDVYERAYLLQQRLARFTAETGIELLEVADVEGQAYFFLLSRCWHPHPTQVPIVARLESDSLAQWAADGLPHHSLSRYMVGEMERATLRMADSWLSPSMERAQARHRLVGGATPTPIVAPFPVGTVTNLVTHQPEIVFLGELRRSNGVEELAGALAAVLPEHPEWQARLVGNDWFDPLRATSMRGWLEARLGAAAARVRFEPLPHDADVVTTLPGASICVAPTLNDRTDYRTLAAMAAGTLVVTTELTAAAALVRSGVPGETCRPGSIESLANALRRVMALSRDERAAKGRQAHDAVASLSSPDRFVGRVADAYGRLRSSPRRAALPGRGARSRTAATAAVRTCGVVIPCRNMGGTLDETLQSVFASTRVPDRVIVADFGSTDDSLEVIARWTDRVTLVEAGCDTVEEARNIGAAAAGTNTIAFLDADDLVSPDFFARAMTVFSRCQDAGFVTAWVRGFGAGDFRYCPPTPHLPLQLVRNLAVNFALFRSDAFAASGGFKRAMRFGFEDWELWLTILEAGWPGLTIPECLFHYRWRQHSRMRSMPGAAREAMLERLVRLHPRVYRRHHTDALLLHMQQHTDGRDAVRAIARAVLASDHREVAVYGAGEWGRMLAGELVGNGVRVSRFVDSNTARHGEQLDGLEVTSLSESLARGDRAFAVGSLSFARSIAATIREHARMLGLRLVVFE